MKYMAKVAGQAAAALDTWSPLRKAINDLNKQVSSETNTDTHAQTHT